MSTAAAPPSANDLERIAPCQERGQVRRRHRRAAGQHQGGNQPAPLAARVRHASRAGEAQSCWLGQLQNSRQAR